MRDHCVASHAEWPTQVRGFLPFALAALALANGCAALTQPVPSTRNEWTQPAPSPASPLTVRAQDGEPAATVTPTERATAPTANPPVAQPAQPRTPEPAAPSLTPEVTTGPLDTTLESLFGPASAEDWTPLSIATLFTEGWNQPFVFSPPSDGGALRQEWINAANGVFYRQWVLDYNFRDHMSPRGNRDIGTWSIFAPLSRRLEMFITIPFVDYHAIDKPSESGSRRGGAPAVGSHALSPYWSTFGDITITPQVMLSETRNTSIMSILAIRTPTGSLAAGNGGTSIGPQIQFWQGLPDRWVIRGGAGPTVPLSSTGLHTTFDTNLTIGRFLTLDEPTYFKELTVWLALTNSAAMDHSGPAADTLTILPGIRFRIARDTWFLYGVEVPLVAPRNEDFGMYFRLVRRW